MIVLLNSFRNAYFWLRFCLVVYEIKLKRHFNGLLNLLDISQLHGSMDFGDSKYIRIIIVCLDNYFEYLNLLTTN